MAHETMGAFRNATTYELDGGTFIVRAQRWTDGKRDSSDAEHSDSVARSYDIHSVYYTWLHDTHMTIVAVSAG